MKQVSRRGHREKDQDDGEEQNRSKILSKISPRGVKSRGIEKGREKQTKNQLRLEPNLRKPGNQREDDASESEENRIGDPDFARDDCQQSNGNKTNQD